jgi:AcrR family transcriptional regulator
MANEKAQPIIWARPARSGRGPQPGVSLQQIARKAIEIADADGLDGLTMRALAKGLDRGTMSIYRYLNGRDDLLDLMFDEAIGEVPLVEHRTWRAGLHWYGHTLRDLGIRHPWTVEFPGGPFFGPRGIAFTEHVLGILGRLEHLSIDEVMSATNMVASYANGAIRRDTAARTRLARMGLSYGEWMHMHGPYVRELVESGKYPNFSRLIRDAEQPHMTEDQGFEDGLERVLDGIEAWLPEPRAVKD